MNSRDWSYIEDEISFGGGGTPRNPSAHKSSNSFTASSSGMIQNLTSGPPLGPTNLSSLTADPVIQQLTQAAFLAGAQSQQIQQQQAAYVSRDHAGHLNPFLESRLATTPANPLSKEQRTKLQHIVRIIQDRATRRVCAQCEDKYDMKDVVKEKSKKRKAPPPVGAESPLCWRCYVGCNQQSCFHCGVDVKMFPLAKNMRDTLDRPVCLHCCEELIRHGPPTMDCSTCRLPCVWTSPSESSYHHDSDRLNCNRCRRYRKQFGSPKACQQCQKVSAFDKGEVWRRSMDNYILCFSCTMEYKRQKHQMSKSAKTHRAESNKIPPAGFAIGPLVEGGLIGDRIPPVDEILCPHELLQRNDKMEKHRDARYWHDRWYKIEQKNGSVQGQLETLKGILKGIEDESRGQQDTSETQKARYQIIVEGEKTNMEKAQKLQLLQQELQEMVTSQQKLENADFRNTEWSEEEKEEEKKMMLLKQHNDEWAAKLKGITHEIEKKREQNYVEQIKLDQKGNHIERLRAKVRQLKINLQIPVSMSGSSELESSLFPAD
eukprot:GHVN01089281.1.p1 GENE.GHVN01089281.1~~GHVN01089281.1.p1  ORF type:complete len:545 (-),score=47.37 GHVN01089281.1:35-1669(-)